MTTAPQTDSAQRTWRGGLPWLILAIGWVVMYGPTYWDLAQTIWRSDDQFHGVLILLIAVWLILDRRFALLSTPSVPSRTTGWSVFILGLLFYIVGRSQDILLFEVGSQIPVLAGALLALHGRGGLRVMWFAVLYLGFMVPLPGFLVDAITGPLKQWVSVIAENLLYAAGYPIARSGVTLSIGPYQLLVADACSGLHSMFSLSALGLLYMYLTARTSWLHNALMLSSILPIAFAANIVRVCILVLVTYHLGDEAGQGFLHGMAGMVLIIAALMLLFLLDAILGRLLTRPTTGPDQSRSQRHGPFMTCPWPRSSAIAVSMTLALIAAQFLQPSKEPTASVPWDLDKAVPAQFGDWQVQVDGVSPVASPSAQETLNRIYSQTLSRTYINSNGDRVMLALAYGSQQTDELKAHRPEVCYPAQGFHVLQKQAAKLDINGVTIPVTRLVAASGSRVEPITYWLAVGGTAAATDFQRKLVQLRFGLTGTIPDGMLIRISTIEHDPEHAYRVHERFAQDMIASLSAKDRSRIGVVGL
jgi:exosortase B